MFFQSIQKQEIYIYLLNEGVDSWRPAWALQVGPSTFVVLLMQDYDPETEDWEFPPGSVVVCREKHGSPVAVSRAEGY